MYRINKEKCIGCGMCVSLCSGIFELKEDGKSSIKEGADLNTDKECVKQAVESCPVGAIEKTD